LSTVFVERLEDMLDTQKPDQKLLCTWEETFI